MALRLAENVDLTTYNTFGVRAKARHFATINTPDDLTELIHHPIFRQSKRLILGGGSNILFSSDFDGLVIHNKLLGIYIISETADRITLNVAAGEVWHPFVTYCVEHDWGGIENLALIPGTVGAAPMQNIGAYGVELREVVDEVSGYDMNSGSEVRYTNADCEFGYRDSIFKKSLKDRIFISSVTLTLTKGKHLLRTEYGAIKDTLETMQVTKPTIQTIASAVASIRQSKLPDPNDIGNAGSFFKNPSISKSDYQLLQKKHPNIPGYSAVNQSVKVPAGWLIEQCGWKGKRIGNAGIHERQALVLVNYGGATGAQLLDLAHSVKNDVHKKFGIELTPEVNIIG